MRATDPAAGSEAYKGERSAPGAPQLFPNGFPGPFPMASQSTADRVADCIRGEVAAGRLTPGTRLREQNLADVLQVSRNTLREALSQLVSERLLVREPNRGVSVATPDLKDVRDLYQARLILEPAVLRAAEGVEREDPHALRDLRAAVGKGHVAAGKHDWVGVADANQEFHRAVVALANSRRIDQYMALLLAEMRLVFHRMGSIRDFHEPYLRENSVIVGLMESGDQEGAADQLITYLKLARDQILAAYALLLTE